MGYLDNNGISYLWSKIKTFVANNYVQKVSGKDLSTNDYTTTEKEKLAGLSNYTLPVATSSKLGGVKSGGDVTVDSSGNVTVNQSTQVKMHRSSGSSYFPVLLTNTGDGSTVKYDAIYAPTNNTVTMNPGEGILKANRFIGNLTGTSSKATGDGSGNNIETTYMKNINIPKSIIKSDKDANGVFTTVTYKRADGTVLKTSVLSDADSSGNYTKQTVTYYGLDGSTIDTTEVYTIAYDDAGDVVSEILN